MSARQIMPDRFQWKTHKKVSPEERKRRNQSKREWMADWKMRLEQYENIGWEIIGKRK